MSNWKNLFKSTKWKEHKNTCTVEEKRLAAEKKEKEREKEKE